MEQSVLQMETVVDRAADVAYAMVGGAGLAALLPTALLGLLLFHVVRRHQVYVFARLTALFKPMDWKSKLPLLKSLGRNRMPLEVFLVRGRSITFLCNARIRSYDNKEVVLEVVYYPSTQTLEPRDLLYVFFIPRRFRDAKVNCIKAFVRNTAPRRIVLKRNLFLDFVPRRTTHRYKVEEQSRVRVRLWFAKPTNGPNTLAYLRPNVEVNMQPSENGEEPRVNNISVDGIGLQFPYQGMPPDVQVGERVCVNLLLLDLKENVYRFLWVGGMVRNVEEDRSQRFNVGVEFTSVALPDEDDAAKLEWHELGPGREIAGLRDILSAYE
jgi:hypothetical protein